MCWLGNINLHIWDECEAYEHTLCCFPTAIIQSTEQADIKPSHVTAQVIAHTFAQIHCFFCISFSFTISHVGLDGILQVVLNVGGHINQNNVAFEKKYRSSE